MKTISKKHDGPHHNKCTAVLICIGIMAVSYLFMRLSAVLSEIIVSPEKDMLGNTLSEFFFAAFAIMIAYAFGRKPSKLFEIKKGKYFRRNRKIFSIFIFAETVVGLMINVAILQGQNEIYTLRPIHEILMFPFFMFFIGIAEEVIFRGIIAESMKNVFVNKDKGAIISGILFGLMHLVNLRHCETMGVLVQVCGAAAAGIIFADIYYYSGTIWTSVILHSVCDFSSLIGFGLFGSENASSIISSYSPGMVIPPLLLIAYRIKMCRMKDRKRAFLSRRHRKRSKIISV